jgi:hypothetical protein
MIDRIKQGIATDIKVTFTVAGTATDPTPDAATVRILRDDGTELIPTTAATNAGVGVFTYPLTPTQTNLLDRLTAYWTVTYAGQPQTQTTVHEIVGDHLFTLAEATARGLTNPTDDIAQTRTRVEQAIEDACGLAFVPRYDRATLSGDGTTLLRLGQPFLRRIRWASTVAQGVTTALLPTDLSVLSISPAGFVAGYTWPAGYGTVQIGFEHGMDRPPEPVRAAALDYARFLLTQDTSIDSRAERLVTDDGTLVFGGGATGLPSVDRVLDSYWIPVIA